MTDPRDKRIAELEARVDKLVDAIAKLASERPTTYPVVITSPAPCTRPHADYVYRYYWPAYPQVIWQGTDYPASGTVTISNPVVGGMDAQPVTMLPRPSPTMTVTG